MRAALPIAAGISLAKYEEAGRRPAFATRGNRASASTAAVAYAPLAGWDSLPRCRRAPCCRAMGRRASASMASQSPMTPKEIAEIVIRPRLEMPTMMRRARAGRMP